MHYKENLKRGIIVDKEDEYLLHKYLFNITSNGYARTHIGGKSVQLHKMLMPDVEMVDHRSRNKLDNRRDNLRPTNKQTNTFNRASNKGSDSKFKGVSKAGTSFRARIVVNGTIIQLGSYITEEEAAEVYNKAALKHHGEFAYKN